MDDTAQGSKGQGLSDDRPLLKSASVSSILRKRNLSPEQEMILLREAGRISLDDFPFIYSAKGQLRALEKINMDVRKFRRTRVANEALCSEPDKAQLKSWLLLHSNSCEVVDQVMSVNFSINDRCSKENVIYDGDSEYGSVIQVNQLRPLRHAMDIYTIELHAVYQHHLLRKLFELDVRDIFYQGRTDDLFNEDLSLSWGTKTVQQQLNDSVREILAPFGEEVCRNIYDLFPSGNVPDRLTFQQKIILAYMGAEHLYALLVPNVSIYSCMTDEDHEEVKAIVGSGKNTGSAAFASRYFLVKTIRRLEAFFKENPGVSVILSLNPAHDMTRNDLERFAKKPYFSSFELPYLYNAAEWNSPNAVRRAIINFEDPRKQERVVELSKAISLSSYQHLKTGLARRVALEKLVGDICDLKSTLPETLRDYLIEFSPNTALRRRILEMYTNRSGVFRFLDASFTETASFREKDSPPWPFLRFLAA